VKRRLGFFFCIFLFAMQGGAAIISAQESDYDNDGIFSAPFGEADDDFNAGVDPDETNIPRPQSEKTADGAPAKKTNENVGKVIILKDYSPWLKGEGANLWEGRRRQRYFEVGLLGVDMGASNSHMSVGELLDGFLTRFAFDPTKTKGSFTLDVDIFAKPLYVRIGFPKSFDLEFYTGFEARVYGNMGQGTTNALATIDKIANASLSPDEIRQLVGDLSGSLFAAASAYAEIGVSGSQTLYNNRLWLKMSPAIFFSMLYMPRAGITLEGFGGNGEDRWMGLRGTGAINMYSAFDLVEKDYSQILSSPGFDISLEGRYAIWDILDVGLSFEHIPIIPSTLHYRSDANIAIDFQAPDPNYPGWTKEQLVEYLARGVNFVMPDLENMYNNSLQDSKLVYRPFRVNLFPMLKLFKNQIFVIQPNVGISLNTVIADLCINYGLDLQFNAQNIFSITAGLGMNEEIWKAKAVAELDFRVFEIDLGVALQGPTLQSCFELRGLGAIIGLKFGY
jgi:hypothetical protein